LDKPSPDASPSEGEDVFATGRKAVDTPALTERSEGAVHPIRADAGSPEDLERVFATVGSQRGRVDVLVRKLGRRVPSSTLPSPTVTARNTEAHGGQKIRPVLSKNGDLQSQISFRYGVTATALED